MVLLEARNLSKRFGATCALLSADLELRSGQVHALMGENGAGKTTMVKMLVGALQPDSGEILLEGKPLSNRSVRDALAAGIVPVYQHSTLFPELSIAENLRAFDVASTPLPRLYRGAAELAPYLDAAARIGIDLDPAKPVRMLSMAERQLLEIVRAVARNCKLLLLDEPTAALNIQEALRLFDVIERLKEEGKGIIFISHKLNEISEVCDVVTVLRDGRTVMNAAATATLTHRDIIHAMVGPVSARTDTALHDAGGPRLEVSGLACGSAFQDMSLSVRCGEIVGIAGLIGSGALEAGEVLGGARAATQGTIKLDGKEIAGRSRRYFKQQGVGLVPADRTADGIFPGLSCAANAAASAYDAIRTGAFLSRQAEYDASNMLFAALRVKPDDPDLPIGALSGGNQQKLVIIRNLLVPDMKLLVVLEPTRGVDVHARDAIHSAIIGAASKGVAVIVASSDLEEVMALAHRICLMRNGRLAKTFPRGADSAELLACMGESDRPSRELHHAHA